MDELSETRPSPRLAFLPTLPSACVNVNPFAVVLVDAAAPDAEFERIASLTGGAPSRALVHLGHHRARELIRAQARAAPPLLLIGDQVSNRSFAHHVEEILYGREIAKLIGPVIDQICDENQAALFLQFLRRGTRASVRAVADELDTSERSLRRLCADCGLPTRIFVECVLSMAARPCLLGRGLWRAFPDAVQQQDLRR